MRRGLFSLLLIGLFIMAACEPTDRSDDLVFALQEGVDTVVVGSSWHDASVIATLDGETLQVDVDASDLDVMVPGEYTVFYEVRVGRTTHTLERTVFVVEATLPVLTLNPGIDTLQLGESFTDAGVTVTGPNQALYEVTVAGTVDVMVPGDYTLTYTLTGPQGVVDQVVRVVTILPPVLD